MSRPNSSTSSSSVDTQRGRLREVLGAAVGFVVALAIVDITLGVLFPYPEDGENRNIDALANYLDYGRSIEAKVRRVVGPTDAETAPMGLAGWLVDHEDLPRQSEGDGPLVAVYGMSFAGRMADQMKTLDPSLTIRMIGGPGAPLNHSYAAWERDRNEHDAAIVVIGIISSALPRMLSLTHMTANFEAPSPHTYPRFDYDGDRITRTEPLIGSLAELRPALDGRAPELWERFKQQLSENDAFYDGFAFNANGSDRSVVARLLRRAWGQHQFYSVADKVHGPAGFMGSEDADRVVATASALLQDFAARSRAAGQLPVVVLFNERGYSDHLYQALAPALEADAIPYFSTHEIAPAEELGHYLRDGHFKPEIDRQIAREVMTLIAQHRRSKSTD